MHELGNARIERVCAASRRFFDRNAEALARAACAMAERFARGGRLFVYGSGAAASDADHVSVEFLHPVIVGQRALPALALDAAAGSRLRTMKQPHDILLAIAGDRGGVGFAGVLREARDAKLLTIAISAAEDAPLADHAFTVDDNDPTVAQEVEETACHVLHELVHLFLSGEHRA